MLTFAVGSVTRAHFGFGERSIVVQLWTGFTLLDIVESTGIGDVGDSILT